MRTALRVLAIVFALVAIAVVAGALDGGALVTAGTAFAQETGDATTGGDSTTWVQGWTVLAAVGAAGVGLVLMMVRVAMGWVTPPPDLDEEH